MCDHKAVVPEMGRKISEAGSHVGIAAWSASMCALACAPAFAPVQSGFAQKNGPTRSVLSSPPDADNPKVTTASNSISLMVTVVADSAEDGRIYNGGGSSGRGTDLLRVWLWTQQNASTNCSVRSYHEKRLTVVRPPVSVFCFSSPI